MPGLEAENFVILTTSIVADGCKGAYFSVELIPLFESSMFVTI